MARTIAINGTRLDEVRMLVEPSSKDVVSSLTYPMSQIRFSAEDDTIRLVLPAYLSVELYRIGILPQDVNAPVEISIGGRAVGRFVVSDVRYPMTNDGPFGRVTFTLARVLSGVVRKAIVQSVSHPLAKGRGTYVTNITHYLDETGEVAPMPGPARKLVSFLTLVIEAATIAPLSSEHDSGVRCRTKACRGTIRTVLPSVRDEISWHCRICGHNGVIRNWHSTRWNQLKPIEGPE